MFDTLWKNFTEHNLLKKSLWDHMYCEIIISLKNEEKFKIVSNNNDDFSYQNIKNKDVLYSNKENKDNNESESESEDETILSKGELYLNTLFSHLTLDTFTTASFIPSISELKDTFMHYHDIKNILLLDNSNFYNPSLQKNIQSIDNLNYRDSLIDTILEKERQLKDFKKRISLVEIQNSRKSKLQQEKETIASDIEDLHNTLENLKQQKTSFQKLKKNYEQINNLNNKLLDIKSEIESENKKQKDIITMKKEVEKLFPQFKDHKFTKDGSLDELQLLFNKVRNINEKIDSFHFKREKRKKNLHKVIFIINTVAISALLSLFIHDNFSFQTNSIIFISLISFSLIFTPLSLLLFSTTSRLKKLHNLQHEKYKLAEKLKLVLSKNKVDFEGDKLSDLYEFLLQYFEDYIEYTERKSEIQNLEESLKGNKYVLSIQEKHNKLKDREEEFKDEIHNCLSSITSTDNDEVAIESIEEEIVLIDKTMEKTLSKISIKNDLLQKVDTEMHNATDFNFEIHDLEKEKESLEKKLNNLKVNQLSKQYILDILSIAIEKLSDEKLNQLINSTLKNFNFLTESRHTSFINENILREFIINNTTPENCSQTIIHTLILTLKITLTEFIDNYQFKLPLIIDDPLQYMDDEKIVHLKQLILDISHKRQVIIFTHQRKIQDWGNYIEL